MSQDFGLILPNTFWLFEKLACAKKFASEEWTLLIPDRAKIQYILLVYADRGHISSGPHHETGLQLDSHTAACEGKAEDRSIDDQLHTIHGRERSW